MLPRNAAGKSIVIVQAYAARAVLGFQPSPTRRIRATRFTRSASSPVRVGASCRRCTPSCPHGPAAQVALDQVVCGVVVAWNVDLRRADAVVGVAQLRHLLLRSALLLGDTVPRRLPVAPTPPRHLVSGGVDRLPARHPSDGALCSLRRQLAATSRNATVELSCLDPTTLRPQPVLPATRSGFRSEGYQSCKGECAGFLESAICEEVKTVRRRVPSAGHGRSGVAFCPARPSHRHRVLRRPDRSRREPAHALARQQASVTGHDRHRSAHTMAHRRELQRPGVTSTTVAHIHCCTAPPESGVAGVATTDPDLLPGSRQASLSGDLRHDTFDLLAHRVTRTTPRSSPAQEEAPSREPRPRSWRAWTGASACFTSAYRRNSGPGRFARFLQTQAVDPRAHDGGPARRGAPGPRGLLSAPHNPIATLLRTEGTWGSGA